MSPAARVHLFAYGTLMSAATGALGRDMRARLATEARSLGPAVAAGRLYHLGRYPGLAAPVVAHEIVHGEVLLLADPDATLAWLDAYEGISRPPSRTDEYERVTLPVAGADGIMIEAWAYRLRRPPVDRPLIATGRWCAVSPGPPHHPVQKD